MFNVRVLTLYASRFGAIGLQSITFFLIAGMISLEAFGEFSFLFAASRISAVILALGGTGYLLRELAVCKVDGKTDMFARYLRKILRSSIVLMLVFIIAVLLAIVSFGNSERQGSVSSLQLILRAIEENKEWFVILAGGYAISMLDVTISLLRNTRSATTAMVWSDCMPFLLFLTLFLFAMHFYESISAWEMVSILAISYFICALCSLLLSIQQLVRNEQSLSLITKSSSDEQRSYLSFWGSSILGASMAQADLLIAKYFLNEWELGVYSLFRKISNLVSMPQVVVNWAMSTRIARQFREKKTNELVITARDGLFLAVPMSVIMLIAFLFSMPLWVGFFEIELIPMLVIVFAILLFGQLFNVLSGANLLFANQCREEGYVLRSRFISLIIGVLAMFIGAGGWGLAGMAIGVAVPIVVLNVLVSWRVRKVVGVWTPVLPLRISLRVL